MFYMLQAACVSRDNSRPMKKSVLTLTSALCSFHCLGLDPIQCAEGTTLTGAAPPQGTQQQCVLPDGTLHGEQRVWYHEGQLMEQRHFNDGKEHGEQQGWWPNGQLMMRGVAVEGKRYGGFKYWDIAGRPTEIETVKIPEKTLPGTSLPGNNEEKLQDAIDQSQLQNVQPLPPASIP